MLRRRLLEVLLRLGGCSFASAVLSATLICIDTFHGSESASLRQKTIEISLNGVPITAFCGQSDVSVWTNKRKAIGRKRSARVSFQEATVLLQQARGHVVGFREESKSWSIAGADRRLVLTNGSALAWFDAAVGV